MFQSFPVILLVVFTCSQSFAMLPHESSSWQREVKMAAEYDADHDINHFLWVTAGLGTATACCLGAYIGSDIADKVTYTPYVNDGGQMYPPNLDILILGALGGASACGGLSFLGIYAKQSNPPSERFIGKSPEYVEYYTTAYTSKARSIRIKSAASGTVTGCVVFLGLILVATY